MSECEWRFVLNAVAECVPAGMPRPVATTFGGRTRLYTPTTVKSSSGKRTHPAIVLKSCIKDAVESIHVGGVLTGPLKIEVTAVFPRPKSITWKTKPMPRELHTAKPDHDNVMKAICDALNEVLWKDDSQIAVSHIEMFVASGNEQPHVEISVYEWR